MTRNFIPHFEAGEIVYWVEVSGAGVVSTRFGVVNEDFPNVGVSVDFLRGVDCRLINGIPISEFESETRYKKLPKGWSYDTKLFKESERPYTEAEEKAIKACDIKKPETIKAAIEAGAMVTVKSVFGGKVEAEIDSHKGWRIVKKYPTYGNYFRKGATVSHYKLHRDYEGAEEEAKNIRGVFEWQANLSDEDWSRYQINEKLGFYAHMHDKTEHEMNKIRKWLFNLERVEDVEVRVIGGHLEWKYWKNKKWNVIEEDAL